MAPSPSIDPLRTRPLVFADIEQAITEKLELSVPAVAPYSINIRPPSGIGDAAIGDKRLFRKSATRPMWREPTRATYPGSIDGEHDVFGLASKIITPPSAPFAVPPLIVRLPFPRLVIGEIHCAAEGSVAAPPLS